MPAVPLLTGAGGKKGQGRGGAATLRFPWPPWLRAKAKERKGRPKKTGRKRGRTAATRWRRRSSPSPASRRYGPGHPAAAVSVS